MRRRFTTLWRDYHAIEGDNVERTLRGEQITEMFAEPEGILRLAQDEAKASAGALARAENERDRSFEAYTQAQAAERVARLAAAMHATVAAAHALLKEGGALQAIVAEDSENLTTEQFPFVAASVSKWLARVDPTLFATGWCSCVSYRALTAASRPPPASR